MIVRFRYPLQDKSSRPLVKIVWVLTTHMLDFVATIVMRAGTHRAATEAAGRRPVQTMLALGRQLAREGMAVPIRIRLNIPAVELLVWPACPFVHHAGYTVRVCLTHLVKWLLF